MDTVNPVLYIFVRKDLQMSGGKIGAQTAQAAIGAYQLSKPKLLKYWWEVGGHHTTITLEARDAAHLHDIQEYLEQRNFNSYLMIDEGMTEVDAHTPTCLATEIVDKEDEHTLKTFMSFSRYVDEIEAKIVIRR